MSTLIVIPARLGATRLPRKPLRLLGGKPLIVRVWERVSAMNIADRVVVATDSPEVADAARSAGAQVAMTRDDHPSGTDRVAEVANSPEFTGYDAFVNVQGDEPFIGADAVRAVRKAGPPEKLVAFAIEGPGIARQGNPVIGGGVVTSGTHSPSLGMGIGLAYVPSERAAVGTNLEIDVRGKMRPAVVRQKPLYRKGS